MWRVCGGGGVGDVGVLGMLGKMRDAVGMLKVCVEGVEGKGKGKRAQLRGVRVV